MYIMLLFSFVFLLHDRVHPSLKILTFRQVMLITRCKKIVGDAFQCVLHDYLIFFRSEHDANVWIVVRLADLMLEVIQIEVHLSDVFMLYFTPFEINQYIAFQNAMVEHQIATEMSSRHIDGIL